MTAGPRAHACRGGDHREHSHHAAAGQPPRRPLLGLRRKPGRLALALFRMPLRAYRHDAGWLLGRTFLEFIHTGRNTGQPYHTVAMVLRYDADAHEAVICAAWARDDAAVRGLIHTHPFVAFRPAPASPA